MVGGTMANAEHEPIMGVWGQSPQRGPGNRELRPGTHARTGANVAFCPGTFHGCALIFKVNVAALLAKFD